MSNKLIQALEPRLMLDGAAVATAIDAVDDLAQFQKPDNDKSSKADHFKVDIIAIYLFSLASHNYTVNTS